MSFFTSLKRLFGFSGTPKMGPGDRLLICADCKSSFVFDEGEQKFFKSKGFTDPKRCPNCRKSVKRSMTKRRRGGRKGGRRGFSSRQSNDLVDGDSPYADVR